MSIGRGLWSLVVILAVGCGGTPADNNNNNNNNNGSCSGTVTGSATATITACSALWVTNAGDGSAAAKISVQETKNIGGTYNNGPEITFVTSGDVKDGTLDSTNSKSIGGTIALTEGKFYKVLYDSSGQVQPLGSASVNVTSFEAPVAGSAALHGTLSAHLVPLPNLGLSGDASVEISF